MTAIAQLSLFTLILTLCAHLALSAQCGISPVAHASHSRIVGGRAALPHEFPWIVYIQAEYSPKVATDKTLFTACEGSLIDEQWIATASHCFNAQPNHTLHQVLLVLGAHDISNKAEDHYVVKPKHIYRNSEYHEVIGSKYDITLVQLPGKLNFATTHNHLGPICLPTAGQSVSKTQCQALGWGKTGPNKDDPQSPILKVVDHNLLTAQECHAQRGEVSDLQVCAGYNHAGTCQGDSGGPLQCKNQAGAYVLLGVTSYGDKMCGGNKAAVFTNVEKFVPWINRVRADHAE